MTLLYLVRHGETELNTKGVYYGWTDCDLNEDGIKQAHDLARVFKSIYFDAVIASPLKRAAQTASIISGKSGSFIIKDQRLRELNFGEWEGKHFLDIQRENLDQWELWCKDWKKAKPPSGESFLDMYLRVEASINDILDKYNGKTVLIVSHQGCLRIIASILLKLKEEGYWCFTFEHGKYSLLDIDGECCILRKVNCLNE